jgi:hypothetical protein
MSGKVVLGDVYLEVCCHQREISRHNLSNVTPAQIPTPATTSKSKCQPFCKCLRIGCPTTWEG